MEEAEAIHNMPDIKGEMDWKWALACICGGFIFAGYVDFLTGVEIRVYPLYFLPLSFAAWRFGRIGAFLAAVGATCVWVESNWVAGMHYSMDYVWIANTLAQCLAFGTVAALLAWVRKMFEREQALSSTDSLTGFRPETLDLMWQERSAPGFTTGCIMKYLQAKCRFFSQYRTQ